VTFRRLVLVVAVLGVAAMAVRPAFDSDTWWHLRTGQWIIENGRAPQQDPFSSTMRGSPWQDPGWLAQVVMLGFFHLGGLAGLTLFTALLVGAAFLLLWPLLDGPILLRAALLLLAAATSAVYWAARPYIASFALAALFLWVLEQWRRGLQRRAIWLLPLFMLLWANLHGGFAIGFILLLMYLLGELVSLASDVLTHRATRGLAWIGRRRAIGTLSGVLLLCLVGASVNPYGAAILAYPFKTVSIPVLQTYIQEWQPPDVRSAQLAPFLLMLVLLVVALGVSRRAAAPTELITSAGWMVLALSAVRHVPVFALVASPVIARHISAALAERGGVSTAVDSLGRRTLNTVLGVVFGLLVIAWTVNQVSAPRLQAHLRAQIPTGAVEAMRRLEPRGRLLNDYNWGGYLLWQAYPAYPTFVDGRTDVFSPEVFRDYLRLWAAQPGWAQALDRWQIGTVLLPPQAPLVEALDQAGWPTVYRDAQAVLMVRPEPG